MSRESYVRGFVKAAYLVINDASPFGPSTSTAKPPPKYSGTEQAGNSLVGAHATKGVLKGLREVVPGTVKIVTGLPASVINGMGHKLGGGSFWEGAGDAWRFADKYYAGPIRTALMYYGGDAVKRHADDFIRRQDDKLTGLLGSKAHEMGSGENNMYENYKSLGRSWEDGAALGTEILGSLPIGGGALKWVLRGTSRVLSPIVDAGRRVPLFGKAINAAERLATGARGKITDKTTGFAARAKDLASKTAPGAYKAVSGTVNAADKLLDAATSTPSISFLAGRKAYNTTRNETALDYVMRREEDKQRRMMAGLSGLGGEDKTAIGAVHAPPTPEVNYRKMQLPGRGGGYVDPRTLLTSTRRPGS